ncbi:MAG: DNRLRE domain-containing protein [Chloroflexi bacterium]|nr:DNRLRE domain-containing protein [Chloroflexota bacterium]MDA1227201.1 DNRLRE domain-containing protein [Chloroflexota bacterium]
MATVRPKPASANSSFSPGGGGGTSPGPSNTSFTLTLPALHGRRVVKETPDVTLPPLADQVLDGSILLMMRDFPDLHDATDRIGRSVLYFDLSPIAPDSTISNAMLTMVTVVGNSYAPLVTAHQIVGPSAPAGYSGPFPSWSSTNVRWNNQPSPDGAGTFSPSLDHSPTVEASGVPAPVGTSESFFGDLTFDLTSLVQDWVVGARLNNGVLMKMGNELTEGAIFCWPPGAPTVPRLIINGSTGGTVE